MRAMAIWGNHSSTQYPDFYHAKIGGKPATEVITDHADCGEELLRVVRRDPARFPAKVVAVLTPAASGINETTVAVPSRGGAARLVLGQLRFEDEKAEILAKDAVHHGIDT